MARQWCCGQKETHLKKNKRIKDPHAKREAKKYSNPIASREVILELLDASTGPLTRQELAEQLKIDGDEQHEALRRRLIAMVRDGQIVGNRKGGFGKLDKMDLIRGRVSGHRDGYGFVVVPDGSGDVYLSNRQMRRVFDGDEVLVRPSSRGFKGRKEGSIVEIITRNTTQLVGRYREERGVHHVHPDNPRIVQEIIIPADLTKGAVSGQLVMVDIIEYPVRDTPPIGSVAEVLGDHLAPGMEIDVAIRSYGVPHTWPDEVTQQAGKLSSKVPERDKKNRFDLRNLPLVTIDGEDARDFDDAVYCQKTKTGGWRVYVAIADVSHYVKPKSALDQEATLRGNSVYFPDFVVPMLPEALSNGLCSLNPEVDRLCMVCEMTISAKGKISGYKFLEAVMHSHARLTYTQVGQVIAERSDKNSGIRKQLHHVVAQLDELHDLYKVLRGARDIRGAIDFETQETRILFDEQRKIKQIIPVHRNDAHKLIEECMLAANVCAAKFLEHHKMPALYRVHEGPKEKKLEVLKEYLGGLGLGWKGNKKVTPLDYQSVLQSIKDRPDAHLIQMTMLRSMNQAVYQPENNGHFGLAYTAYAHFTSPIRRYPDLMVHRAIRRIIRSDIETTKVKRHPDAKVMQKGRIYPYEIEDMLVFGEQCSTTERRADDATRDVVSWLKCEYLQDHVGEVFEGVIAAVVPFGLFVELKDLYVEGLVHITSLPKDYYHHEPALNRMVGERTGQSFTMGDELTVRVARVDLDERKIDFEIESVKPTRRKKPTGANKAKPKGKAKVKTSAKKVPVKKTPTKKAKTKPKAKAAVKGKKTATKKAAPKNPAKKKVAAKRKPKK